jgi:hypothetical protein
MSHTKRESLSAYQHVLEKADRNKAKVKRNKSVIYTHLHTRGVDLMIKALGGLDAYRADIDEAQQEAKRKAYKAL